MKPTGRLLTVHGISFCSPIFAFAFIKFSCQGQRGVQTALPWVNCAHECFSSRKKKKMCVCITEGNASNILKNGGKWKNIGKNVFFFSILWINKEKNDFGYGAERSRWFQAWCVSCAGSWAHKAQLEDASLCNFQGALACCVFLCSPLS